MADIKIDESLLRGVVEDVLAKLGQAQPAATPAAAPASPAATRVPSSPATPSAGRHGVFASAEQASEEAYAAFLKLKKLGVEGRAKAIAVVKELCVANAPEWGRFELEETKIGRLDHKIEKLQIIRHVPGVEWLRPDAMSGDSGITLEE